MASSDVQGASCVNQSGNNTMDSGKERGGTEETLEMEGMTFASAVQERYSHLLTGDVFKEPQVIGCPGGNRVVEFVGMDKTASIIQKKITRLTLSGMNITEIGDIPDSIQSMLKQVEELDLSRNKITSWETVAEIVSFLPLLTELLVSENPQLECLNDVPLEQVSKLKGKLSSVTTIVLANCGYKWGPVTSTALSAWPTSLQTLNLHGNCIDKISSVPKMESSFVDLRCLDLSGNPICDWNDICKLGDLPSLEQLNLSYCKIRLVEFPSESLTENSGTKTRLFPKLEKLNIGHNQLDSWRNVAELNKFQVLVDLNLKGNPILTQEKDYAKAFNLILGRVGKLTKLNNEMVTDEIFQEAEKYYLKVSYQEFIKDPSNYESLEWKNNHPRFFKLVDKLGAPEVVKPVKSKYISVVIVSEDGKEILKKLPASTTVSSLKVMVKKIFGLDPTQEVTLVWKPKQVEDFLCPLDDDTKTLSFYDISDEDVILIH